MVQNKSETIKLTVLENVVQSVDVTVEKYSNVLKVPTNATLLEFIAHVESLVDGAYKSAQRDKYNTVRLLNFVTNPMVQEAADFTNLGILINPANLTDYRTNLQSYIASKGAVNITTEDIQKVVNVTDALITYQGTSTVENLDKLIDALTMIDQDTNLSKVIRDDMRVALLKAINKGLGTVTEKELTLIGVTDVVPKRLTDYQSTLKEYSKTKIILAVEDLQAVIDASNASKNAKETPSTVSIKNAYDTVNKLEYGSLLVLLLKELEDLAVEFIRNNPNTITVQDLKHANIENVNPDSIDDYKGYLVDVLAGTPAVTKEDIQKMFETINAVKAAYSDVLKTPTRVNLELFISLIEGLVPGKFKVPYVGHIPAVTIQHINYDPSKQDTKTYAWAQLVHKIENMDAYNNYLLSYVEDHLHIRNYNRS